MNEIEHMERMRIKKIFSFKLNQLLNERHLQKQDVAKALNVSCPTLTFWCDPNNSKMPKADKLFQLADYFNVSVSTFTNDDSTSDIQLLKLINNLSDEEVEKAIDYINYLISQRK